MVTQCTDDFVVIFGNHRLEAYRRLGWKEIPAIVEQVTDVEAFILQLVENIQRNLKVNPIEEAKGYRMLIGNGMTIQEIGSRIGKSYQYVWSKLRLLEKLHPKIVEDLEKGRARRLTSSHAEQLSMLKDPERQLKLARAIEDHDISLHELEKIIYAELSEGLVASSNGNMKSFQVSKNNFKFYEHSDAYGDCRITFMTEATFNILAKYLGKKARTAAREAGRTRRRGLLERVDKSIPKLEFLIEFFNDTFGWGRLSITESEVIINDSILKETTFLTGYMEGYLGLSLQPVSTPPGSPMVFKIVGKISPRGEDYVSPNTYGC